MRRTPIIATTFLATAAALAAGFTGGASAKKVTQLHCTMELVTQGPPNPSSTHLGSVQCPAPFGSGEHFSAFTVTPAGTGAGAVAATFTNTYERGTASGTASLTFSTSETNVVTYTGTVTYTSGTGKFKHVRGSGTIECTSTNRGATKSCTVDSTLTGI